MSITFLSPKQTTQEEEGVNNFPRRKIGRGETKQVTSGFSDVVNPKERKIGDQINSGTLPDHPLVYFILSSLYDVTNKGSKEGGSDTKSYK